MRNYKLKVTCIFCGKVKELVVDKKDFDMWKSGKLLIQDAMPYLSSGEREILISQICEECFDSMFK